MLKKYLFPFPTARPVQREMLEKVYEVLQGSRHLIVHAPTGIGKTAASLCSALAYALESDLTVFFLTPKHSQHRIAIETLQRVKRKFKLAFCSVDIIGKRWLCGYPGAEELSTKDFQQFCKALREEERCKFYNLTLKAGRLSKKAKQIADRIASSSPMHVEDCRKLCNGLCAYEILMRVARRSSVIVCDYYHIFNPAVAASFLFKAGKEVESSIFIVDEAQNLPDRIRGLLSERASGIGLARAMREASKFGFEKESNDLRAIYSSMDSLRKKKLKQADEAFVARKELIHAIEACLGMDFEDVILEFDHIGDVVRRERLKSYCGGFSRFLEAWFESDERYVGLVRKAITTRGREIFVYRLHCLDPSIATRDMIDSSHSVIAMSGTLTPTFLYRDVLGFDAERTELIEYPSVFPKENRLNLIVPGITSKYSRRGPEEYRKFASYLRRIIKTSPPNIAVFFPCYEMLNAIVRLIKGIDKEVLIERRGMSKEQRTLLLARFREALNERGAVLFGVSGASFAEGVDYPGNMLKCVVIAGLPLERPDLKTKALIDYYQRKFKAGWAYGYIFPAVMRAVQAGGRCIRSSSDRGVVIFMDERFLWKNYLKAFPRDFEFSITKEPERLILDFWKAVL